MDPFTVTCCQVRSFDLDEAEANLQNLLAALDEAGRAGAQLVALPECAYPAYYLGDANPYARPGVRPFAEVAALFAERARRHGYWLAAGMAVPHGPGQLTNSGLVFGPDGAVRGRYDKSFLWHFDNEWFERGRQFPVFDAGFCRFGVLICADGRQPEVARMLTVAGAEVILDLTAWVSWGRTPAELSTTQCEYLMPTRAFENGVWVAAADKWGQEAGTIVYAGRSCVIDPEGVTRVCAASQGDAVVTYRVEPMAVARPRRRPGLYAPLVRPTATLPAVVRESEPLVPAEAGRRVAVVPGDGSANFEAMARQFAALRRQQADLVIFGGRQGTDDWETELAAVEAAVRTTGGAAALAVETNGAAPRRVAVLITPEETVVHAATHGSGATGEVPARIVETAAGSVGLLCGEEGLVPEVARCLALDGADLLVWPMFTGHEMTERVVRTRADENRVYVASAWPQGGMVASPDGALLTTSPVGWGVAMTAPISLAFSRWKERAPGTNVIRDRVPEAYEALVR